MYKKQGTYYSIQMNDERRKQQILEQRAIEEVDGGGIFAVEKEEGEVMVEMVSRARRGTGMRYW